MTSVFIKTEHSIPVVEFEGRLDTTTNHELEKAMAPILEKETFSILDLSKCNYLSSAGIRVLLVAEKKLLAKQGGLFICGMSPELFQVIEMAGLHTIFRLFKSTQEAISHIEKLKHNTNGSIKWTGSDHSFEFIPLEKKGEPALLWKTPVIAGYNQLNISIGIGSAAETAAEESIFEGLFVTCCKCAGFIPDNKALPSDFRIPQNPTNAGIMIREAISFSKIPAGYIKIVGEANISLFDLADSIAIIKERLIISSQDLLAMVVADFNPVAPSVSICMLTDKVIQKNFTRIFGSDTMWGAKFVLSDINCPNREPSLSKFLELNFSFENIISVEPLSITDNILNPLTWLFVSNGYEDAESKLLKIENEGEVPFGQDVNFLIRRLYTDSARIVIKQLHGGFSAQTYQVDSFDSADRKLRPTVLKIANRAMITREAERCQKYALPYILNNSAIVLGAEFFGDTGVLRYNFVGIGGEQTQLKWLAHYYAKWDVSNLDPLFDKIFLQILNPWYGQPVKETIYPYRDHNPTMTFFPDLCKTAEKLFSISSDEQFFTIEATSERLINPYWFLKHEFPKRGETGIEYYTSICHGDLNMQNILLDQQMNVYLIDFSETKPRSVISDFARLEAIFMIEHAPLANEKEVEEYTRFISNFYKTDSLDQNPLNSYSGEHKHIIEKNVCMALKMREFALKSVKGNTNLAPYYIALLEWTLPIVCYQTSAETKRISMVVSGLLCNKLWNP